MTLKRSWIKRSSKPWPSNSAADHARTRRRMNSLAKGQASKEYIKADGIFARLIKERDQWCVRCGKPGELDCSHFISRERYAVRYDYDNAAALCRDCHTTSPNGWEYAKKRGYRDYMIKRLGVAGFEALEVRSKRKVSLAEAAREYMEMVRRVDTELEKAA